MSKYFNNPTVGIDVSADFSYAAILKPNGDVYKKSFKVSHDVDGFNHLLKEIRKVEEEFNMKTGIFMESTGVYQLSLFHFLKNQKLEVYLINPLVTNCNKNKGIRKVKNDKQDALSIAELGKFQNIKAYSYLDIDTYTLKSLCRDYYKLVDTRSTFKKKLSADLRVIFPGYTKLFVNVTSVTSLALLKAYPSPKDILNASKEDVTEILKLSKKGLSWVNTFYDKLIKISTDANLIGIYSRGLSLKILSTITTINNIEDQIKLYISEIKAIALSNTSNESLNKNLKLLMSIPGIGFISAVTILTEIGDINSFLKPKQLVAYFGIDPSVNQSGKFKSDKDTISKRGTRFGRRALYAVALASIRKTWQGNEVNKVLYDFYNINLEGKKKKVAIVAIMHKLINYIFAVLRDQKKYEQRQPQIHKRMYLENQNKVA